MAIRNLRLEGDEILNKKSREVEVIDDKLQILIDDMIETMHKYNGVGLAAVQVGILKRVIVIDLYDDKGPIVLINPVILKTKGEHEVDEVREIGKPLKNFGEEKEYNKNTQEKN